MAMKPLPPQHVLRNLLDYNPETGALMWRERPAETTGAKIFNTLYAGKPAFTADNGHGYLAGQIPQHGRYLAHRVIWAWLYDDPSEHLVDHINGNKSDNRAINLRLASKRQNSFNMAKEGRFKGASFDKSRGLWQAKIRVDGRQVHLGRFRCEAAAAVAYAQASTKHYGAYANWRR